MVNTPNGPDAPRKPGRPTKQDELVQRKLEKRRNFLEKGSELGVKGLEGFQTCWVTEDKIDNHRYKEGYDFVAITKENVAEIVEDADTQNELIASGRKKVGKKEDGSPLYAYLMARPHAVRDAIRAEKRRKNDEIMGQIERGQNPAKEGEQAGYLKSADISVTRGSRPVKP